MFLLFDSTMYTYENNKNIHGQAMYVSIISSYVYIVESNHIKMNYKIQDAWVFNRFAHIMTFYV